MYTLVLNEKGECEVVWCTANETFYLDNRPRTTSPYAVHIAAVNTVATSLLIVESPVFLKTQT